ncbi:tetratricopeptide repeat protein [Anabaena sp. PCC 7108]|uniref:tetratricopeptide repeat protein n=1 Tax=Anabaena sp. PCC 7108 TaxID=163908 RepID=UPI00034AE0D1|nr:tetratricopeptide repeat protein [Anabaena sp. PCC 7108]
MKEAIEQLCQMAVELIQSHPQASPEQLAKDLQQALKSDSELAASFRQSNYGNAKGFQTFVTGGTAYIGDNFHVDKETLQAVLEIFQQQYFPQIPTQLKGNPFTPPQPREGGLFGREEELTQLHQLLQSGKNVCVVSGMGGVGKTGLVREYANLTECTSFFTGGVYYIDARDRQNMATEIIALTKWRFKAELPANLSTPQMVKACWQQWKYQTENVLLIFDDVSGLADNIKTYLPPKDLVSLRLLMTSRENPETDIIEKLELKVLSEDAARIFLGSIIGQSRIDAELEQAKLLCYELGYLPLALELVAYYLDDEDYQELTLEKMRGKLQEKIKHPSLSPEEVPGGMQAQRGLQAAFDLSWDELKPEAKHLACVLGAFAASPVYWGFVTGIYQLLQGESFNEDNLKDRWLKSLRKLHLVITVGENIYNLHLLIHDYFSEHLKQHSDYDQIKQIYCDVFIDVAGNVDQSSNLETFNLIETHLKKMITWCQGNENTQLAYSLNQLALLYESQGRYNDAELLYLQSLKISKCQRGADHPLVASSLNNLAGIYESQGRYNDAELLYLQSLKIRKLQLDANHPDIATSLNNLALLYKLQGNYNDAEPLYLQSLEIRKRQLVADHSDVAQSLNNLAELYTLQGNYNEAEPLYLQSLEICKRQLGADHPNVATGLNNLAELYRLQGRYNEAEPLYLQSSEIRKHQLSPDHPDVAQSLNNLALLYESQGRYNEAEPLFLQSLEIWKCQLGADHPDVATSLNNLAVLYETEGRYNEAETLFLQSLDIRKRQLSPDHPDVADSLNNLAELYRLQGRYNEAETLFLQSLEIKKRQLGTEHPSVATSLNNLALLYYLQGRYNEAEPLYLESLEIKKRQLGADHPSVATSLNNLAELYRNQGRYNEAEPLWLQSLEIWKRQLGADHPYVAQSFNNLAELYRNQGRYNEAEPLYLQSLEIWKRLLGADHPSVATSLNNLALLYEAQGKYSEAEDLAQQALVIYKTRLGNEHPNTQNAAVTVKLLYVMRLLGCNKETLIDILKALVQQANLPALNNETALTLLEMIESNPQLLSSIREFLQQ